MLMAGMLALLVFMALFAVLSINYPRTSLMQILPEPLRFVLADFGRVAR